MIRKFVLALSLAGLVALGGGVIDAQPSPGASITCFDCWEMKFR